MIKFKNKLGQGLVELVMAITVIEIGLFSVWSLFLVNYNSEREAQMRIVAVNLAREGVEIVKNIRDSNWLKFDNNIMTGDNPSILWSWDYGLNPGNYNFDYKSKSISLLPPENNKFVQLYFDDDGFYTMESANNKRSFYERSLNIKNICCSSLDRINCSNDNFNISEGNCSGIKIGINVVSEVRWNISGRERNFKTEINLYNWQ